MYAVQDGLPVLDCLCARKSIVNKKIPERWGQKTLWICTAKMNITPNRWRVMVKWNPVTKKHWEDSRSQIW